ncbi:hypothetical protein HG536_0C00520 [Torulaspora globosa]|uniref:Uncharacterized protein n=1 Tax=Torulaspora globosa TaxID=48254 RepID=A0A7G3ZEE9_9SACH|nr:uncharacterized protein HG536_0C00520 [Torulaspora globosa]QLL31885.1 hypothetical protein HG536_0C00520 [Torulaspora globosa]
MSHPIPQMVDISHALQSSAIEKMRSDIRDFQQASELSQSQFATVKKYMESLETAFAQFTKDNQHIESGTDPAVTAADKQLYSGLKAMYADYLLQLGNIWKQNSNSSGDCEPLDYIVEELPYLQPTERKSYIDNLILGNKYDEKLSKSGRILEAMINLCVLDSTLTANLRSYITFLRKIGFSNESLRRALPADLSNSPWLTESSSETVVDVAAAKKITTDRAGTPPLKEQDDKNGPDDEKKKKISFSRYLKKGDVPVNENGKRKSSAAAVRDGSKKVKKEEAATLNSILKASGSSKKNSNNIKFVDDSILVKVYGDGLPNEGLYVAPEKLKKILKPFKEGEPRETVLIENYKKKAPELDIEFDLSPEEFDVTETKGGPIPCETVVPLKYRLNFTNFSSELSSRPPREPVVVEEPMDAMKKNKGPLIVRAFGKNSLLLRKDRGGLPYKRVPEVVPIDYPSRASQ